MTRDGLLNFLLLVCSQDVLLPCQWLLRHWRFSRLDCLKCTLRFYQRWLRIDDSEVNYSLELAKLTVRANNGDVVNQKLVFPGNLSRELVYSLCRNEVAQVDIDVGKVDWNLFLAFIQLYDNSQSFLSDYFDWVDWGVQYWNLSVLPLSWLHLILSIANSLLKRRWLGEEPITAELQLQEDRKSVLLIKDRQEALRIEL